jgi:lysozyme
VDERERLVAPAVRAVQREGSRLMDTFTTGIIDVAHWETASIPHLAAAKAAGLHAVIAKCTQGKDARDKAHPKFRDECKRLGLLFGDYHFGSGTSPGEQQADWYLRHADPDALHALDWEWQINVDKAGKKFPDMSVAQAEAFVVRVHEKTGRWPLVYTSRSFLTKSLKPAADSVLANCPLWLCWYLDASPDKHLPLAPWKTWELWQYSNGHDGPRDKVRFPRETPHLGGVDRNAFLGDEATLRQWWGSVGRVRGPQCAA